MTATRTRICVNCDGPHALAACPQLAPVVHDPSTCSSCEGHIDPRTGECACSD